MSGSCSCGRDAATLTMPRGEVLLKPFGRLDPSDAAALDEDAAPGRALPGRRRRLTSMTATPIVFAGALLDRAPLERRRPEWLAAKRATRAPARSCCPNGACGSRTGTWSSSRRTARASSLSISVDMPAWPRPGSTQV